MMNVQMAPPTYAAVGNPAPPVGNPPRLGQQVPGQSGGLPAQGGLSVTQNPMAKQLQSYGRGDDKMLVHMTPGEVSGLQQLAMAHGGSLTINPHTGLPEAGWLGKLLPTLIGFGLAATGIGAPLAAGMVAAGQTALTGDLSKGLMAGLGAFGGAGLAGAVGAGAAGAAANTLGSTAGSTVGSTAGSAISSPALTAVNGAIGSGTNIAGLASNAATTAGTTAAKTGIGGLLSRFGQSVTQGLPAGTPSMITKAAPMLAGTGLLGSVSGALQPSMPTYDENADEYKSTYNGPYVPGKRELSLQSPAQMQASGGAEHKYFTPSNPPPRPVSELTPEERTQYGFADGGVASLPASDDFQAMVNYFSGNSPGAITASMRPDYAGQPSVPAPASPGAGEIMHFNRPSTNPVLNPNPGGGGNGGFGGLGGLGGLGGFDLSNLGGLDINGLANQYGYSQNTPIRGETDVGPAINNPAVTGPGNIPGFSAPDIMDFGLQGRDRFEPGYRPEMLNIQSPEDNYPQYAPPAMEGFQYAPPAMQDFQYAPPAMQDFQQDFQQYAPPAMEDFQYAPPAMQDFQQDFQQYTPPSMQDFQQDFQQYTPPSMRDFQYAPPAMEDFQQYTPPSLQDFQQYAPPAMEDFQQYTPPSLQDFQYAPPAMQDFQYAPPAMQESVYDYGQDIRGFSGGKRERNTYEEEYARGGEVDMRNGSFVVDARTVSELGNGSSNAGMELLSRMGGRPLQGPGDGVSDSIRARIGGKQEARVARDEVLFTPEAVKRVGGGNEKRGTAKLYALMDKAHKARKKAKRGEDTKVRKGLA